MNCPNCGLGNPPAAKFCRKCGQMLMQAEEPPVKEAERTPQPSLPAEEETTIESSPAELEPTGERREETCPYCGGSHCDPITKVNAKFSAKGPSTTGCCCGICLFGPVGALCGLCGMGAKVDMKQDVVWICRDCGKEHLSRADALEKTLVMTTSYALVVLLGALVISAGVMVGNWPWLIAVGWAFAPLICWELIKDEVSGALGYPLTEILPPSVSVPLYLVMAEVVVVLVLLFGGPIVDKFVAGL